MNSEDRFTEWALLGKGGTATVYKATDTQLGVEVAIKILDPRFAANQATRATLKQEILTSRRLRHPFIIAVHDFYDGPRGFGIVMDVIPGAAELRDWMDENKNQLKDTAETRLEVLKDVFRALEVAHQVIVHRDLKPQNIMLLNGDIRRPIIMDFGLALNVAANDMVLQGYTPKYASPEQWFACNAPKSGLGDIDARSDLFTMGVIAYELFTNRIPECAIARRQSKDGLAAPAAAVEPPSRFCAGIPPALDGVILSLMQDDPKMRPQTARDVLDVLDQVRIDHNASLGVSDAERRYVASIPEGSFILGSGPESSNAAEKPRRRVNISAFQIDQFPVSNADFKEFVDRTGHSAPPYIDHEVLGRDNHPVVGVNWDDAMAYANWKGGRLPTEAEWEYVAKGGEKRIYPWGDDQPTPTHANIDRVYEHTTPVGQFAAGQSGFGVSDLCGNTWEWCQDSWNEHQYDLVRKGDKDPVCALQSDEKSVRGGAFNTFAEMGRNAARYHFKSDTRSPAIGFRLVYPAEG